MQIKSKKKIMNMNFIKIIQLSMKMNWFKNLKNQTNNMEIKEFE